MFSLTGNSIHKTKTAYCCLLLLGSASVAGVTVADTKGQFFNTLGQKIGGIFQNTSDSDLLSGQEAAGVTALWGFVSDAGEKVKEWVIMPSVMAFTSLKTTYKDWWKGLKFFFNSLVSREMYQMFFKNLHTKISQTISFLFAGGQDRNTFISLFKQDKLQNTLKVGKFLLGVDDLGSSGKFKAGPNLFNYLLFQWLDNPKKITSKFKKLSDRIGDASTIKNAGAASSLSSSSSVGGEDKNYTLETKTLQEYLDVKDNLEDLWIAGWLLEVATKIKTGRKFSEPRTAFTLFGNLFGW